MLLDNIIEVIGNDLNHLDEPLVASGNEQIKHVVIDAGEERDAQDL